MSKERLVIIGAGLCGSVLAMRLRNAFDVTVIEQSQRRRPLLDDIECSTGGVTTSINRGAGLGGTTNYWHNALIELDHDDLLGSGIDPAVIASYYTRAWELFLPQQEIRKTAAIGAKNVAAAPNSGSVAHMVVPYARVNLWSLAEKAFPGDAVRVVYGHAQRVEPGRPGLAGYVEVRTEKGLERIPGERFIVSAGGLATPVVLAGSTGKTDVTLGGYHDHPMAYIAKVRLRSDSILKRISCQETGSASVRTGFVYRSRGLKAVFFLRPALSLDLKSITGEARYLLSDLRNDPFSPRKIGQLLMNLEALREAILFKSKAGFLGDFYSVLMLGEQEPRPDRGLTLRAGKGPSLNWGVTDSELAAYSACFDQFQSGMAREIIDRNLVPTGDWDCRTAAHHSGSASDFLDDSARGLAFFAARELPGVFVCDGSVLRRGGVANSGLTLVALAHQLADELIAAAD